MQNDAPETGATAPEASAVSRTPEPLLNRELSLLEFNRRVLEQARDSSTPLLERLRFLTICSTNLDEFFEIRVAGLRQQIAADVEERGSDGKTPQQALREISKEAHELVDEQYRVLREVLTPRLEAEGIRVRYRTAWTDAMRRWVSDYFAREVLPVLTPVGLDPAHPFPAILNKSLNFFVALRGKDAFGRRSRGAVVQAPRLLPRLIALPKDVAGAPHQFVTLTGVIHENVSELFPGMTVTGCYPFRVTRNSDLWVDEEEVDDLLRALKGELPRRNFGEAVRLEVNYECTPETEALLAEEFDLEADDIYRVNGPVNLHRLSALIDMVDRPDLRYTPFAPSIAEPLRSDDVSIFDVLKEQDILLHHPYQSFTPVVQLLQEAASDPDVLAIKITLYRTGASSPMTEALLNASRQGKEVTAVVELRARFDEAANIDIAQRLQEAGAKVVYGIVGFKSHAKMTLVVRRENDQVRRYVHLGTGNYHMRTAKLYTDVGLLTCDEELGEDVHNVFQQLTGLGRVPGLKKLVQSPFRLFDRMVSLIDEETENALAGRPAAIKARMNALIEPRVIDALYRASQAGVKIDLMVRGACCLRPGVPGVSENIRVISVVGRFLEHSRIFWFCADGRGVLYCSSADWMPRNFFRRVEIAFPIDDEDLRRRVLEEGIDAYLVDNTQAWELHRDGHYERLTPAGGVAITTQTLLLEKLAAMR